MDELVGLAGFCFEKIVMGRDNEGIGPVGLVVDEATACGTTG